MEKPHVDLDQAPVEVYGPLPLEELGDAGIVGGKVSMCYMVVVSNAPWIGGYKPNPFLIPIKTSNLYVILVNPCTSYIIWVVGLNIVFFHPNPGEMIQFYEHSFQMGWFNHPLG